MAEDQQIEDSIDNSTEAETQAAEVEDKNEADKTEITEETPGSDLPDAEVASPSAAAVAPAQLGYKGEIVGEVIKLEDLEADPEAEPLGQQGYGYDELAKLVDETLTNVSAHEIVSGKVVSLGDKDVVIDIGFKSDGIVSKNEFDEDLAPGDVVEVYLERIEDYHGQLVLSKSKADKVRRWKRIESAFENEEILEGTIVRRIKGGMIVELFDGVEAFLPGSQIDVRPVRDFDAYLEKRMEFKIVKLNPANENIVVSHKALIEKDLESQREKILATMEPGQILEGTVKNITDFGVFIDLGGVDGLLHITDLSWGRVSHPSELVNLDEKLNVVVLDYDKERHRISLGLKQLHAHPWENISERFNPEDVVEGKVVSITDYGAFVELDKGIEGLVHISEMSWTEHIKHPSQVVSLGQMVKVKILQIDHEGKKISLGMKQLEPDPWQDIVDRYPQGTALHGKVRNVTNFGVFVEIEPGIDGLVHISDLSWLRRLKHPSEIVKKGQDLDVVVLGIDLKERRISLGHKQIEDNPWPQYEEVYAVGTKTNAVVSRIEDNGVVVTLPLGVEAFLPGNQTAAGASSFEKALSVADMLEDLQIIQFDMGQKDIVVSQVAEKAEVQKTEKQTRDRAKRDARGAERRDVRSYQKEMAAQSPTTLGELSGLEAIRKKMADAEQAESSTAPEEDPGDE